ncbi:GNAT family N-acetyltransferase [Jejuia spongiicola]|uniref:GNAT family N-acetyltransferase n=1 Tax=Jejuia spongiicola TaxID=2942207 RepID=A0ABT0QAQ8_9FLAO|nr:GNAT family N-acetyltransferase [Jejuia spongiicola]MCL6293979.1 GNAT family N-acetyltransferase [Jejuia spongiicola]
MQPIVRKATLNDVPILLEFEQGLIEAERPMDITIKEGKISYYDVTEFIKNKDSELFVVELNNEIVASGYAKIKEDRHYLKHDKQGYLGFMFVPKKHRGNGYNKLVMQALLEWCQTKEITEIRLDVYEDNPSAIRAYEKVGFKKHMISMRLDIENLDL